MPYKNSEHVLPLDMKYLDQPPASISLENQRESLVMKCESKWRKQESIMLLNSYIKKAEISSFCQFTLNLFATTPYLPLQFYVEAHLELLPNLKLFLYVYQGFH